MYKEYIIRQETEKDYKLSEAVIEKAFKSAELSGKLEKI